MSRTYVSLLFRGAAHNLLFNFITHLQLVKVICVLVM